MHAALQSQHGGLLGSPGGLELQKLELVEWLHSSFDQGNVNHG